MDANTLGTLDLPRVLRGNLHNFDTHAEVEQVYLVDYQAGLRFEGDASSIVLSPGSLSHVSVRHPDHRRRLVPINS